jgi:hypothetical protein
VTQISVFLMTITCTPLHKLLVYPSSHCTSILTYPSRAKTPTPRRTLSPIRFEFPVGYHVFSQTLAFFSKPCKPNGLMRSVQQARLWLARAAERVNARARRAGTARARPPRYAPRNPQKTKNIKHTNLIKNLNHLICDLRR